MVNGVERLNCQELVELVTDYLEGALADDDRRRFEEHLSGCDGCQRYVEQMRRTIRVTGTLRRDGMSPEAERALLEAFRTWKTR